MIVTLTANPSLDRTVLLADPLRVGEVQRAVSTRDDAGGKGVNVSRVLAAAGARTLAVVPIAPGDPYAEVLSTTGVPVRIVPGSGRTRVNLTVSDPAGTTTKINLPGVALDDEGAAALVEEIVEASAQADWLVLAGSLPPGAPADLYADIILAVRARGPRAPRVAVDASGAALRAVASGSRPDLIKPNDEELAELVGERAAPGEDMVAEAVRRARTLVPGRAAAALVTLGAAGALLVTAEDVLVATPPPIRVASTVGAGDSSLAGFLLAAAGGASPAQTLRTAVAYGAAAASLPGTQAPAPGDLPGDEIVVAPLRPST